MLSSILRDRLSKTSLARELFQFSSAELLLLSSTQRRIRAVKGNDWGQRKCPRCDARAVNSPQILRYGARSRDHVLRCHVVPVERGPPQHAGEVNEVTDCGGFLAQPFDFSVWFHITSLL